MIERLLDWLIKMFKKLKQKMWNILTGQKKCLD